MPSYVINEKCDGCKGGDKTACEYICPNDLMTLDEDLMKAYNAEPDMCWECYNCVKICPSQAIEVRGYADFTPLGANVVPLRGSNDIMWTVSFRGGTIKRFKFPIRTVAEGNVVPDGGFGEGSGTLDDQLLFTEPASLKADELWTL
ncbi:MAG: adenylyl-sulfate reductase subunit beta [Desulfotignum sp.]|jgi:adenylylsulfate reductase, subunit B|nr:adenylyl-sulfate reductase subunit beta [Desulfotignum sp.]MCF8138589.1 adenylyl-sulfate reductase subunit beta [Desulfotignum sp.]